METPDFMSNATTTSTDTGQHTPTRGRQREAQQPVTQQERSAAQRLRTTMAAQNVVPVAVTAGDKIEGVTPVGLRSVPVGGSGGGFIRGRKSAVAVECGEWRGRDESGVKTPRGAGP
jgi:hypothetical protein